MNAAERVVAEVRTLPEFELREVLDFVGYLKARHGMASKAISSSAEDTGFVPFIGRWRNSRTFVGDALAIQSRLRDEWCN